MAFFPSLGVMTHRKVVICGSNGENLLACPLAKHQRYFVKSGPYFLPRNLMELVASKDPMHIKRFLSEQLVHPECKL